jgi:hypothetical protein
MWHDVPHAAILARTAKQSRLFFSTKQNGQPHARSDLGGPARVLQVVADAFDEAAIDCIFNYLRCDNDGFETSKRMQDVFYYQGISPEFPCRGDIGFLQDLGGDDPVQITSQGLYKVAACCFPFFVGVIHAVDEDISIHKDLRHHTNPLFSAAFLWNSPWHDPSDQNTLPASLLTETGKFPPGASG